MVWTIFLFSLDSSIFLSKTNGLTLAFFLFWDKLVERVGIAVRLAYWLLLVWYQFQEKFRDRRPWGLLSSLINGSNFDFLIFDRQLGHWLHSYNQSWIPLVLLEPFLPQIQLLLAAILLFLAIEDLEKADLTDKAKKRNGEMTIKKKLQDLTCRR